MIYDLLEVFRKEYAEKGDKLILDTYLLKDGLYVKINRDDSLEYFIFTNDKKQDKKENCFKDLQGNIRHDLYDWFKERDYYSNIIETSKAFDAPKKMIHNNNYLTLFIKIEKFIHVELAHIKDKLFSTVMNFKSFSSNNEKMILEKYCDSIRSLSRKKDIVYKYRVLENIFDKLKEFSKEYSQKFYLKIFFDENMEKYKRESEIYLALKIFNKNKYNIVIDNVVFGQSNSNSGINTKKLFDENLSRKKHQPFMLSNKDALLIKIFFDWLYFQSYNNYPLHKSLFLNKYFNNGQAVVNDFDYLPVKIDRFDTPIVIKNYLNIRDKEDYKLSELWQLEEKVDDVFYDKQLIFNYFKDDIKVSNFLSKELQNLIYITKHSMINYFRKFDDREFYQVIKKYGNRFVIEHLQNGWEQKARESLNLRLSLLKHKKGDEDMDIEKTFIEIKERLIESDYRTLSKEEFFFLSGQIAYYLLAQKEQHQKKQDLIEPYLRCNNARKLKKELAAGFFQYKHALFFNNKKFNNALSLIQAYEGTEKMSDNMGDFLVGYLSDNMFFEKKES